MVLCCTLSYTEILLRRRRADAKPRGNHRYTVCHLAVTKLIGIVPGANKDHSWEAVGQ